MVCDGALIGNWRGCDTLLDVVDAVLIEAAGCIAPGGGVPLIGAIGNAPPRVEALECDLSLDAISSDIESFLYVISNHAIYLGYKLLIWVSWSSGQKSKIQHPNGRLLPLISCIYLPKMYSKVEVKWRKNFECDYSRL